MATFIASALWHGFYPGFFVFFIAAALLDLTTRSGFHRLKFVVPIRKVLPRWVEWLFLYAWMNFAFPYFANAFFFLTFERFNKLHRSLYWSGHVIIPLVALVTLILPKVKEVKSDKKKD